MFEKTIRKFSFTFQQIHFSIKALNHARDDLLSRQGFTDVVDELISRLAQRGEGVKMKFTRVEFETLTQALMKWHKTLNQDSNEASEAFKFMSALAVTPDRAGTRLYAVTDSKER